MRRAAATVLLALAGCSAEPAADLLPVPTPVYVGMAPCATGTAGCTGQPTLGLSAGWYPSIPNLIVVATRRQGTTLRIALEGVKERGMLTALGPATAHVDLGAAHTVELVWNGQVDRYRVVSADSLAPLATSFSTPRRLPR